MLFYFIQTSAPLFRVCNFVNEFLRILNNKNNNIEKGPYEFVKSKFSSYGRKKCSTGYLNVFRRVF